MARKSGYKPEYEEQAYRLALLGLKDTEIAKFFNIVESTLNEWKLKHPEFSESLKKGKIEADGHVVKALYNRAIGMTVITQQAAKLKNVYYENGKKKSEEEDIKIVELKQELPPDTVACIYWLKNRQPDKWRDKVEQEHKGSLNSMVEFMQGLQKVTKDV